MTIFHYYCPPVLARTPLSWLCCNRNRKTERGLGICRPNNFFFYWIENKIILQKSSFKWHSEPLVQYIVFTYFIKMSITKNRYIDKVDPKQKQNEPCHNCHFNWFYNIFKYLEILYQVWPILYYIYCQVSSSIELLIIIAEIDKVVPRPNNRVSKRGIRFHMLILMC